MVNSKRNYPSVARSLPIALMHAREHAMTPIRSMLAKSGLTEQQWRILRVLSEYGEQDISGISERACLLLPSLTRLLRTMESKKLIRRSLNKTDKRRQMVKIAAKGQKILEDNQIEAAQIVEEFQTRLGAENYHQLLDLLQAFSASYATHEPPKD